MEFLILIISLLLGAGCMLGIPFLVHDSWRQVKRSLGGDLLLLNIFAGLMFAMVFQFS